MRKWESVWEREREREIHKHIKKHKYNKSERKGWGEISEREDRDEREKIEWEREERVR